MSSVSASVNDPQDRPDLVEIHQCVTEILASLDVAGVEFFLELDGETLKLTLQTKKFLEAQDLAIELGKKIEQLAAADIRQLAVYKRKTAETKAFAIKEMALGTPGMPTEAATAAADDPNIPTPINNLQQPSSNSFKDKSEVQLRPKLRIYGLLNSYILRTVSAFAALGIGILAVSGISRIFDSMEQKPLTYIDVNQLPGLMKSENDGDVTSSYVTFPRGTHVSGFVVYLPTHPAKAKIPCIFIAPSGTTPLYGQKLTPLGGGEYRHYVKAGYAVITHDVDGAIEDMSKINEVPILTNPDKVTIARLKAYKAADGGVLNAKLAIDYAFAKIPQLDPNAIYTAGYGSGGTIALMTAVADKRVKGAIAFTPVTDIPKKFPSLIDNIAKAVPGYLEAIERFSPYQNAAKITKPLFIFQDDGSTVNLSADTNSFIESVSKSNSAVTFFHATVVQNFQYNIPPSGVQESIDWLNAQQKN
jgi:hypothetical protein